MSARRSLDLMIDYLRAFRLDTPSAQKPLFWLGAGCSLHDGVPLMDDLLRSVLAPDPQAWGSPQFRFDQFATALGQGRNRATYLAPFVTRTLTDDSPYRHLVRLLQAGYVDVVCTLNIDNLLDQALAAAGLLAGRDYLSVNVPELRPEVVAEQMRSNGPRIRIVKLHGASEWGFNYMTSGEIVAYDQSIERLVTDLTSRAAIVCGYSFFHLNVLQAFSRQGGPLFYANPRFPDAPMVLSLMEARNPRTPMFVDGDLGDFRRLMQELEGGLGICP